VVHIPTYCGILVLVGALRVTVTGPLAHVQLAAMRLAAHSGHIQRATVALGRVFPSGSTASVVFPSGNHLEFALADPYWCRLAVGWEHESEVRATLDEALTAHPDALLLDCGANIGYWPAWYAPRTRIVAVEALPHIYERLARNAARSGFTALHRAIWSDSETVIPISWSVGFEPRASVVHEGGDMTAEVATVAIDALVDQYAGGRPVIVKLDVEGAELAAIDGAVKHRNNALWIYEDHGYDTDHTVTRRFLALGFRIRYMDERRHVQDVGDLGTMTRIKEKKSRGYNFIAVHPDGPWSDFLGAVPVQERLGQ
jgi:FkbM family methyltransferase